jgi:hypothetical protein
MFQEAFKKLELDEVARILDQIGPLLEETVYDPLETTIMALDLPFYPGYRLLDIGDYTVTPPLRRYVVYSHDDAVILNFTNEPIYELNKTLPIELTESRVLDYVRFFFSFVRGKHGRFLLVENIDDIQWKEDPPAPARKAISKMIKPLYITNTPEDGTFHLQACMMFKDSLFRCAVTVASNGHVTIKNEELLIEDVPVLDDTFGI